MRGRIMAEIQKPKGEELRAYITEHIDQAIEESWIDVFYQPVLRTLTNEICGLEALARWKDPQYGLLNPDDFISALEKAHLIHKLDCCVIHQLCLNYVEAERLGVPTVPVSFNLSRLDFQLCDIHQYIQDEIHALKVPRDALRVEITESMMETNAKRMRQVIDRFWECGLRVWMDDFGSGYSSLNVLKDYHFDTLKIDMVFLRNDDMRSREIVKSVVDMSKRIGIHTLAEGVETAEQLAFLKSIGCEKAQGYYIGKPMPIKECDAMLTEKGYLKETPAKAKYHHEIGKVNVLSATPFEQDQADKADDSYREGQIPLAIVEHDGKNIRYVYTNENYRRTLSRLRLTTTEEVEREFAMSDSYVGERFLEMMNRARKTHEVITIDFMSGRNRLYARVRWIAGHPGGDAYLCSIQNLSDNRLVSKISRLEEYLPSMFTIYDRISIIDMKEQTSENLYQNSQTRAKFNVGPVFEEVCSFARSEVYPDDRERYLALMDPATLEQRITENPNRHISGLFRMRGTGADYIWKMVICLFAADPLDRKILLLYRKINTDASKVLHDRTSAPAESGAKEVFSPEVLWKNYRQYADTAYFWKDRERRFVGANQAFLNYFGFDSEDVLIGKTDEDMGWHIDPEPYVQDEKMILRTGEKTYLKPGHVLCKGQMRSIAASKIPIYREGEIIGIMGYFLDMTDWKNAGAEIAKISRLDPLTGSLSLLGVVEAVLRFQDSYAFKGLDFAMYLFDVRHFHMFTQNYGSEWSNHLLLKLAEKLQEIVGAEGVCGRINGDHFLLVHQVEDRKEVDETIAKIISGLEEIREVDGVSCTIYLHAGYSLYSETKDLQKMFAEMESRMRADRDVPRNANESGD